MEWNEKKVAANIANAATEDLIDQVTVYRGGMQSEALAIIETELRRRGVKRTEIDGYLEQCQRECLFHADGTAKMCSFCRKPAVAERWGWHRLMNKIPIVPRRMRYCKDHDPV